MFATLNLAYVVGILIILFVIFFSLHAVSSNRRGVSILDREHWDYTMHGAIGSAAGALVLGVPLTFFAIKGIYTKPQAGSFYGVREEYPSESTETYGGVLDEAFEQSKTMGGNIYDGDIITDSCCGADEAEEYDNINLDDYDYEMDNHTTGGKKDKRKGKNKKKGGHEAEIKNLLKELKAAIDKEEPVKELEDISNSLYDLKNEAKTNFDEIKNFIESENLKLGLDKLSAANQEKVLEIIGEIKNIAHMAADSSSEIAEGL